MKPKKTDPAVPTSIRMDQETREIAAQKAKTLHMTRNQFLQWAICHADPTDSMSTKVRIQNAYNAAMEEHLKGNPDALLILGEEIRKIW